MTGYAFRFGVWAALLFALLYVHFPYTPSDWLNGVQTDMAVASFRSASLWLGLPTAMEGKRVLFENGLRLQIVQACNGLAPFLLYAAAILAYPAGWRRKLFWLAAGYLAISAANTLRLLGVAYAAGIDKAYFAWAHNIVGRNAMLFLLLMLFYCFTGRNRGPGHYGRSKQVSPGFNDR